MYLEVYFILPGQSSVFTAEACVLFLALEQIEMEQQGNFLICTDSKSFLQAIESPKTEDPIVVNIIGKVDYLKKHGFLIVLCWILGHMGLAWNELADKAPKEALQLRMTECQISTSDVKPILILYISKKWQMEWDECVHNKLLYEVKPNLCEA